MIDPTKLKAGQSIQLKQVQGGKWQEWLMDKEGNIVAVEDIDPFKYSKEKALEPNNYEELKKNYQYLSKTEQSPSPIVQNEPLPFTLDIDTEPPEMEPPEREPIEDEECGGDYNDDEREPEEEEKEIDQEIKENPDNKDK